MMNVLKKPEILSPAGNFEKMESAFLFGADAVYLAGKGFGMRAAADNFDLEELERGAQFARNLGKKIYLTVNVTPSASEIPALKSYLKDISTLSSLPHAVICTDLGVISLVRDILPDCEVHISTQANTQNYLTCMEYQKLGASRIILSREVPPDEIRAIRENIPKTLEIECFVHGSMCVSYSGRCLLSNYLTARDANKGKCTQPCRWKYYAVEEKRLSVPLEIAEDMHGTFLFSSRDLCMIDHVDDLVKAGVSSFKIEGRMKSAYYAAVITNAYRIQLDKFFSSPEKFTPDETLRYEVESVSHREYDTGYFYARPIADAKISSATEYIRERAYLGVCVAYDDESKTAVFRQRNKVLVNTTVQILTPGRIGCDFHIDNMTDVDGNAIEAAPHPSMIYKIRTDTKINVGDIMRSKS